LFSFLILFLAVSLAAIPTITRHHQAIFALGLIVLAGSIMWEVLFSTGSAAYGGRAAGFTGNPNIAGELLVALTIASVDWRKPRGLDGIIWLIAGVAMLPTFSRGGLATYVLVLAAYLAFTVKLRLKTVLKFAVLAVFCVFILVLGRTEIASFLQSRDFFSGSAVNERISMLTAVIAQGDFSALEDPAGRARAQALYDSFGLIDQSPLLGHGTGFTYAGGIFPHNIYLTQWINNGALGLVLLVVFLFASVWHFRVCKDVRGVVFVAAFFISGFFSHNLLEQPPFMVMFGLLGALAYVEHLELGVWRSSLSKA
jgi:O-antigen ligase